MGEKPDKSLAKARKIMETVIKEIGVSPDENKVNAVQGGYAWQLTRGSADILISLIPGSDDRAGRLRIVSPVVKVEDGITLDIATRLLALNGTEMPGVFFGTITGNVIAIITERLVTGLDKEEARQLLTHVGYFGDKYDDLLVNEFGGKRICDLR